MTGALGNSSEAGDGAVPECCLSEGSANDSHRTEHQSPRSGPCRESAGMNALLLPKDTADSDEASADAGAGAARGGLSSKLRAAAERGESQGSDDASSTPRGRPKSKPSAVPPRELVR